MIEHQKRQHEIIKMKRDDGLQFDILRIKQSIKHVENGVERCLQTASDKVSSVISMI